MARKNNRKKKNKCDKGDNSVKTIKVNCALVTSCTGQRIHYTDKTLVPHGRGHAAKFTETEQYEGIGSLVHAMVGECSNSEAGAPTRENGKMTKYTEKGGIKWGFGFLYEGEFVIDDTMATELLNIPTGWRM